MLAEIKENTNSKNKNNSEVFAERVWYHAFRLYELEQEAETDLTTATFQDPPQGGLYMNTRDIFQNIMSEVFYMG